MYLRLDTLAPVPAGAELLYGPNFPAVIVRRPGLGFRPGSGGSTPYLPISAGQAVRLVEADQITGRAAQLAVLSQRDGWFCLYCGCDLDVVSATVEHIVPREAGGPDHASNLCLSCGPCNAQTGHLPAAQKVLLAVQNRIRAGAVLVAAERKALEARS